MAIEKMTFIDINGNSAYLDEVLQRCLRCGLFQPEYASKLSEYSFGTTALLRNPFGGLMVKITEIASQLRIDLTGGGTPPGELASAGRDAFLDSANESLNTMRKEYPRYFDKRGRINDEIISYTMAVDMLGHINAPDMNFDELWRNKYLKIRFGRLPTLNAAKLEAGGDKPYEIFRLDSNPVQTWCFYVMAEDARDEIDQMFREQGFERLRIPDYVHGTTADAMTFLKDGLEQEQARLREAGGEIDGYIARERERFLALYSQAKFLHDAYDLRKYVVSIQEHFHLVGFVLAKDEKRFTAMFSDLGDVAASAEPAGGDPRVPAPVKLRNNWFVRPFEMFVNMYGSPSYNDIDPSPFVAYTYSLLFGMMFGDMGHGFCVFLLGVLLWKFKKIQLGAIMSRIGVVSMVFGFLYGSVFGFEHLLDVFYTGLLGLSDKPIEVMHPDTTNKILAAAIALGAVIILMVIIFNIAIGIKHRDFSRTVLSHNGVAGLVLYLAVMLALFEYFTDTEYLSQIMETFLIVIPLVIVFFREPIVHLIEYRTKTDILNSDQSLKDTLTFQEGSVNLRELFGSQFVSARFGRIPTDSYNKLTFYQNEPFVVYPVKSERDYIWCIYTAARVNKDGIDAIFRGLNFERLFIPEDQLASNELAESYIKRCVEAGGTPGEDEPGQNAKYGPVRIAKQRTAVQTIFPDGIGAFITQNFFEMFEVVLSFITNTMSFLRVGGFILVHAGMMAVVFTLAEMVGGGASPVIIMVGNIFVMCLEGLIVGIQVLRLEFYEIFSRFFDADGEPFVPVTAQYGEKA